MVRMDFLLVKPLEDGSFKVVIPNSDEKQQEKLIADGYQVWLFC
jgi:hypothetical protein